MFFIGLIAYNFFFKTELRGYNNFDYTKQDSVFFAAGNNAQNDDKEQKNVEKRVDYQQELLDFRDDKINYNRKAAESLQEHSVNINKASAELLQKLPGIGMETASKIISYRDSIGGFKSVDELSKVKGIGNKRFIQLKKYVVVE